MQTGMRSEDRISILRKIYDPKEEFGFVNDLVEWFRRAKNGLVLKERSTKFL